MRLKEDSSSWRSRGIIFRDHRHDHSGPEVDTTKVKRNSKPRKKIDHKHVWVEESQSDFRWTLSEVERFLKVYGYDPNKDRSPNRYVHFGCSVAGCKARKHRTNMRYGYEYYKWRKNRGR